MAQKTLKLTFFAQNHARTDWKVDFASEDFQAFVAELVGSLAPYGIVLEQATNPDVTITVNSYADLLNSVRISSPADGFASLCVGHVIGKSANLDVREDIKRAVSRVAFAPETIPPEDHNRKVCHNCGCGC